MQIIAKHTDERVLPLEDKAIIKRNAARAIALDGDEILLMYTARYDDYSLPGGGMDEGETPEQAMIRELEEETGAQQIRDIRPFGCFEEYRPWYRDGADVMHMLSYCFYCRVDRDLGTPTFEHYEINNGMRPVWVSIDHAIAHNKAVMANSEKAGQSLVRETMLLEMIAQQRENTQQATA
ncbi:MULTISPECIES: NUDIX hydrolase [Salinivibrio]|uniref:DNA mismatch repair protein MutT n=1 Tax=Salinivibrio kushneri TaxID=1908198 RepID=A0AB36JVS7_9GAMM|nr:MULTISPECIES: NUDIX hydrolase [Salinivibrio]ODP96158.1 DNA mismatch repair protein MutT [Salinivibrio sp. BNH]OOE33170.1 DNA mismatch repair protein MutT [Salinivibrio kushneri]OOE39789.1 DNA mismatch repair protein MutT [Salinivibrio kushneri]OOE61666.1 DNA mismatch repair protein MutT [Salinivibrio kushneri]OOE66725.1 DNA mismatch repair protein MutT [Salinivibrio kushneri]